MNLPDIISRARSVIEEAEGADEHAELLAELTAAEAHAERLVDLAQTVSMGNTDADRLAEMATNVLAGRDAVGAKLFYEQPNVGTARYTVNFHDGVEQHDDGSPFYGTRIFRNKRAKDTFVRELKQQGYAER